MATLAFKFSLKIALFIVIIVAVSLLPYDQFISAFVEKNISFQHAEKITAFIEGEPAPEVFDAVYFYLSVLLNIFITIIVYSAIVTTIELTLAQKSSTHKRSRHVKQFIQVTVIRLVKIFSFIAIFCLLLRLLPYEHFTPANQHLQTYMVIVICIVNLLLSSVIYGGSLFLIKHR